MFGLHINNFRSFVEQDFEFSKINILIGTNSSGKSSLLKFLMMMNGTLHYNNGKSNLNLLLNSWQYDFGTYQDLIRYHDTSQSLSFSFRFGQEYLDWFVKIMPSIEFSTEQREFVLYFISTAHGSITTIDVELTKNLQISQEVKLTIGNEKFGKLTIKPKQESKKTKKIGEEDLYDAEVIYENGENISTTTFKYKKKGFFMFLVWEEQEESSFEFGFLAVVQTYLMELFAIVAYINPIDTIPKRNYTKNDDTGNLYLQTLDDVIQFMVDESIDAKFKQKVLEKFAIILNDYGLAKEIKLVRANNINAMELQVRLTDDDFWTNIKDVGLGVPLQIPMLMQAIVADAEGGKMLLFEQPEVHIHPKLQAKFMEALVKGGSNNTYFIETHSEHIIRMLQVLVKEKTINSEDVTIHYFTRENDKSAVSLHHIQEDGFLDKELPEDFFDVSYHLASRLLQNS